MAMASFSSLLAMFLVVAPMVMAAATGEHGLRWVPVGAVCEGSIEECMGEGGRMEMSRRILATSQYISYKALQRNTVPCSQKGASYYNCQPGAQANPYTRGCATITRCRTS